jgi:hypothetical protein
MIMEECRHAKDSPLVVPFIDFSKAFDSIKWNYLSAILQLYGVPNILRDAIMSVYYGTNAHVRTNDGISDPFPLTTGVLQGDTLAPYLFIIVLDYVMRRAIPEPSIGFPLERGSARTGKYLTDLIYADDIATFTTCMEKAERLLVAIEREALPTGLKVNRTKTEAIHIPRELTPQTHIKSTTGSIEWVQNFKYLGCNTESSYLDLNKRLNSAWKATKSLRRIWKSPLTDSTKIKLFQTLTVTILLYGAETWILTKSHRQRLLNGYNRLLRYSLNIHFTAHTKTIAVYDRAKLPSPAHLLAKRLLQFTHRILTGPTQPAQDILKWNPKLARTNKYRSQQSYKHMLYNIASHKGITPLSKLTPTTKIARTQDVLSNIKDKNFLKARIQAIPFNLHTLEELQKDHVPHRPRKRKQLPAPDTATTDDNDLSNRMDLA